MLWLGAGRKGKRAVKETTFHSQAAWVLISALLLTARLGESDTQSPPYFSHVWNGDIKSIYRMKLFWGMAAHSTQCLLHGVHSISSYFYRIMECFLKQKCIISNWFFIHCIFIKWHWSYNTNWITEANFRYYYSKKKNPLYGLKWIFKFLY